MGERSRQRTHPQAKISRAELLNKLDPQSPNRTSPITCPLDSKSHQLLTNTHRPHHPSPPNSTTFSNLPNLDPTIKSPSLPKRTGPPCSSMNCRCRLNSWYSRANYQSRSLPLLIPNSLLSSPPFSPSFLSLGIQIHRIWA